jgi:hypothetical protein
MHLQFFFQSDDGLFPLRLSESIYVPCTNLGKVARVYTVLSIRSVVS